eukprot:comp22443_c0_seq1/m.55121 comp22443_c0_seq1/g.55121  ORF comp22443_c0_seq1/g.55121 comp22443_c0_seq1/m.55121 type:complete len:374 (-) comp22443_c0_seq1:1856-2977(-)
MLLHLCKRALLLLELLLLLLEPLASLLGRTLLAFQILSKRTVPIRHILEPHRLLGKRTLRLQLCSRLNTQVALKLHRGLRQGFDLTLASMEIPLNVLAPLFFQSQRLRELHGALADIAQLFLPLRQRRLQLLLGVEFKRQLLRKIATHDLGSISRHFLFLEPLVCMGHGLLLCLQPGCKFVVFQLHIRNISFFLGQIGLSSKLVALCAVQSSIQGFVLLVQILEIGLLFAHFGLCTLLLGLGIAQQTLEINLLSVQILQRGLASANRLFSLHLGSTLLLKRRGHLRRLVLHLFQLRQPLICPRNSSSLALAFILKQRRQSLALHLSRLAGLPLLAEQVGNLRVLLMQLRQLLLSVLNLRIGILESKLLLGQHH